MAPFTKDRDLVRTAIRSVVAMAVIEAVFLAFVLVGTALVLLGEALF